MCPRWYLICFEMLLTTACFISGRYIVARCGTSDMTLYAHTRTLFVNVHVLGLRNWQRTVVWHGNGRKCRCDAGWSDAFLPVSWLWTRLPAQTQPWSTPAQEARRSVWRSATGDVLLCRARLPAHVLCTKHVRVASENCSRHWRRRRVSVTDAFHLIWVQSPFCIHIHIQYNHYGCWCCLLDTYCFIWISLVKSLTAATDLYYDFNVISVDRHLINLIGGRTGRLVTSISKSIYLYPAPEYESI